MPIATIDKFINFIFLYLDIIIIIIIIKFQRSTELYAKYKAQCAYQRAKNRNSNYILIEYPESTYIQNKLMGPPTKSGIGSKSVNFLILKREKCKRTF